jgi:hypothetical protein
VVGADGVSRKVGSKDCTLHCAFEALEAQGIMTERTVLRYRGWTKWTGALVEDMELVNLAIKANKTVAIYHR